jgi:iron complex outermembrane receptor protein
MIGKHIQIYLSVLLAAVLYFLSPLVLIAQTSSSQVKGIIIDSSSGSPLEYALVGMLSLDDTTIAIGTLSDEKGMFEIDKIKSGHYILKVSFIGYTPFVSDTIIISSTKTQIDLDSIYMLPSREANEIVITAENEAFSIGLDKNVFEVAKNPVVTGGSATDVLKQIPAVSVDIDGKISMRGSSNVIVWINGKPSGLTGDSRQAVLDQIPASNIERVEIINNPSARYDPDGTSGIINIVLKKNIKFGTNGSVTGGLGTRDRWNESTHKYNNINKFNGSASLNFRKGKWNFSSNYGARYGQRWQMGNNLRDNFQQVRSSNSINQYEQEENYSSSHLLSTSLDYSLDTNQTIGMTAVGGYNNSHEEEILNYDFLDSNRTAYKSRNRDILQRVDAYNTSSSLYYRKTFSKPEKEFYISGSGSYTKNNTINTFNQQDHIFANDSFSLASLSHTKPFSKNTIYVFQTDYTLPYNARTKFEIGAKSTLRILDYDLYADSLQRPLQKYVRDDSKTNRFIYKESVYAAYGIVQQTFTRNISAMAGLRIEQAFIDANLTTLNQDNKRTYTNFFPSAYVAKKISTDKELRFTYSKRINRPNAQALNPFPNYSDPLNLSRGNSYLNPEYIHSFDLSFMKTWRLYSLTSSLYYRQINGTIQRVSSVNAQDVSITQFYNLNSAQNFGAELIGKMKFWNRLNVTSNINVYRNTIQGNSQTVDVSNSNYSYFGKLMLSTKIWKGMDVQVTGNYNSPVITLQGTYQGNNGVDIGLKKDFWKTKGIITLNIADVFNTRNMHITSSGTDFSIHIFRKKESRVLTLSFTYKFGRESAASKNKKTPKPTTTNFDGGGGDN